MLKKDYVRYQIRVIFVKGIQINIESTYVFFYNLHYKLGIDCECLCLPCLNCNRYLRLGGDTVVVIALFEPMNSVLFVAPFCSFMQLLIALPD